MTHLLTCLECSYIKYTQVDTKKVFPLSPLKNSRCLGNRVINEFRKLHDDYAGVIRPNQFDVAVTFRQGGTQEIVGYTEDDKPCYNSFNKVFDHDNLSTWTRSRRQQTGGLGFPGLQEKATIIHYVLYQPDICIENKFNAAGEEFVPIPDRVNLVKEKFTTGGYRIKNPNFKKATKFKPEVPARDLTDDEITDITGENNTPNRGVVHCTLYNTIKHILKEHQVPEFVFSSKDLLINRRLTERVVAGNEMMSEDQLQRTLSGETSTEVCNGYMAAIMEKLKGQRFFLHKVLPELARTAFDNKMALTYLRLETKICVNKFAASEKIMQEIFDIMQEGKGTGNIKRAQMSEIEKYVTDNERQQFFETGKLRERKIMTDGGVLEVDDLFDSLCHTVRIILPGAGFNLTPMRNQHRVETITKKFDFYSNHMLGLIKYRQQKKIFYSMENEANVMAFEKLLLVYMTICQRCTGLWCETKGDWEIKFYTHSDEIPDVHGLRMCARLGLMNACWIPNVYLRNECLTNYHALDTSTGICLSKDKRHSKNHFKFDSVTSNTCETTHYLYQLYLDKAMLLLTKHDDYKKEWTTMQPRTDDGVFPSKKEGKLLNFEAGVMREFTMKVYVPIQRRSCTLQQLREGVVIEEYQHYLAFLYPNQIFGYINLGPLHQGKDEIKQLVLSAPEFCKGPITSGDFTATKGDFVPDERSAWSVIVNKQKTFDQKKGFHVDVKYSRYDKVQSEMKKYFMTTIDITTQDFFDVWKRYTSRCGDFLSPITMPDALDLHHPNNYQPASFTALSRGNGHNLEGFLGWKFWFHIIIRVTRQYWRSLNPVLKLMFLRVIISIDRDSLISYSIFQKYGSNKNLFKDRNCTALKDLNEMFFRSGKQLMAMAKLLIGSGDNQDDLKKLVNDPISALKIIFSIFDVKTRVPVSFILKKEELKGYEHFKKFTPRANRLSTSWLSFDEIGKLMELYKEKLQNYPDENKLLSIITTEIVGRQVHAPEARIDWINLKKERYKAMLKIKKLREENDKKLFGQIIPSYQYEPDSLRKNDPISAGQDNKRTATKLPNPYQRRDDPQIRASIFVRDDSEDDDDDQKLPSIPTRNNITTNKNQKRQKIEKAIVEKVVKLCPLWDPAGQTRKKRIKIHKQFNELMEANKDFLQSETLKEKKVIGYETYEYPDPENHTRTITKQHPIFSEPNFVKKNQPIRKTTRKIKKKNKGLPIEFRHDIITSKKKAATFDMFCDWPIHFPPPVYTSGMYNFDKIRHASRERNQSSPVQNCVDESIDADEHEDWNEYSTDEDGDGTGTDDFGELEIIYKTNNK